MEIKNYHIVKSIGYLLSSRVASSGIKFFSTLILARYLGASNYGLIILAIASVEIVRDIIDVEVGEAVVKFASEHLSKSETKDALKVIQLGYIADFLLGAFSFTIIFLLSPIIAKYLHQSELTSLIRLYALCMFIVTTNGTSTAIMQIFNKFKWISAITIVIDLIFLFGIIVVYLIKGSLYSVMIIYIFQTSIATFIYLYLVRRILKKNFNQYSIFNIQYSISYIEDAKLNKKLKEMIWFLIHLWISLSFRTANKRIGSVMLGYFKTPADVAYYEIAVALTNKMGIIAEPISRVLYPNLSQLWAKKEIDKYVQLLKDTTRYLLILMIPLSLVLSIFSEFFIGLLYGKGYIPSALIAQIIIIGTFITIITCWTRPTYLSMGAPHIVTYVSLGAMITIILGSLILVPSLSYIGSAITYTIMSFGVVISMNILIWKKIISEKNGVK